MHSLYLTRPLVVWLRRVAKYPSKNSSLLFLLGAPVYFSHLHTPQVIQINQHDDECVKIGASPSGDSRHDRRVGKRQHTAPAGFK